MKTRTLIEKYKAIQKIGFEVDVPFEVWCCISSNMKVISIAGDHVSLGEDYVSLQQARSAVEWYVNQLGGNVDWGKE